MPLDPSGSSGFAWAARTGAGVVGPKSIGLGSRDNELTLLLSSAVEWARLSFTAPLPLAIALFEAGLVLFRFFDCFSLQLLGVAAVGLVVVAVAVGSVSLASLFLGSLLVSSSQSSESPTSSALNGVLIAFAGLDVSDFGFRVVVEDEGFESAI